MTRLWLATSIVATVAALGLAVAHVSPALLGASAAVACLAFAFAAGSAALALDASDRVSEPRAPHGPSHPEPLPPDAVSRGLFGRMWLAALGAFAALAVVPVLALARRTSTTATAWSAGARVVDADGKLMRFDTLDVGSIETVFPEGHAGAPLAATLLLRLHPDVLRGQAGRADWSPDGNVAYSKICTHAGCPVAIYRQTSYQLYCPCHQSVFDVLDAARPVSGPATRALPQLALAVDGEGYLIARGDFSEPVGPDMWDRPI